MAPILSKVKSRHYLKPLNVIYKSKLDYLKVLDKQIKIVLGSEFKIQSYVHEEFRSRTAKTCINLVTPEGIRIDSLITLTEYCKLKNIDENKIKFLTFELWNFKINQDSCYNSHTFIAEKMKAWSPMARSLKRLSAKKFLSGKINQLEE